jgi:hypothetical protein
MIKASTENGKKTLQMIKKTENIENKKPQTIKKTSKNRLLFPLRR